MRKIASRILVLCLLCSLWAPGSAETKPDDPYDVRPVLCNPDPSSEAQALMNWMCAEYGSGMISGQYLDEYQYGAELEAIASVTGGLYPAMVGMDFLNYSPSSVSLGSWPTSTDQAIEYWKKGYIVTFCWHWNAPEAYLDTTGDNWWGGFYTQNTTFDLGRALSGEDPAGYDLLIRDMDAIAVQLTRLRDAGVPVLWRPLHEASGGWFWWSASGAEAYITLYRLMYDRFTGVHGLNNLIWVWNGQSRAWYPGDDVVDIIGEDIYPGKHVYDSQTGAFARCRSYTDTKKLIMLSECGCVPSPAKCRKDGAMWSAWGTWCYEFVLTDDHAYSSEYTDAEALKKFYGEEITITRKDVPLFGREIPEEPAAEDGAAEPEVSEDGTLTYAWTDGEVAGNALKAPDAVEIRGNEESDIVTLRIQVPESGDYRLSVLQAGIGGYKENYLMLDGEEIGTIIVQGEQEETCDFGTVHLNAGEHEIAIRAFWGWVRMKSLILTPEK